jgi:hypothetical protein
VVEVRETLDSVTTAVKASVSPDAPLGVGLWLAHDVARELADDVAARDDFRRFLDARGFHAFTLNAFPYGGFHEVRVKERVFRPSWAEPARAEYTMRCAEVLATLLDAGEEGSISTVPLGMSVAGFTALDRDAAVAALRTTADRLRRLADSTGRRIVLSLEPEPCAALDTIAAATRFLDADLFVGDEDARREVLGVCIDACHEAVLFQEPAVTVAACVDAGVRVGKVQVTSALQVRRPAEQELAIARLRTFDEGRYFQQAAARFSDGTVEVAPDLEPFLVGRARDPSVEVARVHFHVPVFAAPSGALSTTRDELVALLHAVRDAGLTDQFEVETYTFDVVPAEERAALGAGSLAGAIARELEWTRATLAT